MPLARHDGRNYDEIIQEWRFLLTCLLRGMTRLDVPKLWLVCRFLLTCLLRGMTHAVCIFNATIVFLLTCLLRGMTLVAIWLPFGCQFLLTCLLRGMT